MVLKKLRSNIKMTYTPKSLSYRERWTVIKSSSKWADESSNYYRFTDALEEYHRYLRIAYSNYCDEVKTINILP
jgi:hypothetical protein